MDRSIAERKRTWTRFLEGGHDRPLLFFIRYAPDMEEAPRPHPDRIGERTEWAWRKYERACARARWLDDDSVPYLDVFTGTEIFAEAFGCRIHRPANDMPFALPMVKTPGEADRIRTPGWSDTPLARLFDIADELRRRAGNGALVKLPDIQSPMDNVALLWDKTSLYAHMLTAPDAVKRLATEVSALMTGFLDAWFERYGREFIAHYPDYYMPFGITLSEDEIGAVGPEGFEEFFLPHLRHLSERYGAIGMHCCASAEHQWPGLLKVPGLRLLNLAQPSGVIDRAYPFFTNHVVQMHHDQGPDPASPLDRRYPAGSRVVAEAVADTEREARDLAARMRWHATA